MRSPTKALSVLAVVALTIAGCQGGGSPTPTTPAPTVVINVDLPFGGASSAAAEDTWNALQLYLERVRGMAGRYRIELARQDSSVQAQRDWDEDTCVKNATAAAGRSTVVAVMGTYDVGCTQVEAPILNRAPSGPMLMVSHRNTSPGLTKPAELDEPHKYFPSGLRSYARVITTDEIQGVAAAQFASEQLHIKKCFVLNDGEPYGKRVADAFAAEARQRGIEVVAELTWNRADVSYSPLFGQAQSLAADCVFIGGNYDNNGAALIRDKVGVLGDNKTVALLAPESFTGYPAFLAMPESEGAYVTTVGLPIEAFRAAGGATAKFLDDYKDKHGIDPRSAYALYGVQALQVILAAVAKSDGTRRSVRDAVFEGDGITIRAGEAILTKEIKIDPDTGDVSARDISIMTVTGGKAVFHKVWPVA